MLYLGADHRGFQLKAELKKWLEEKKIVFTDLGNMILDPLDDYVDFGQAVAKKVAAKKADRGIVICGSGIGVSVAANKIKGIRAGLVFNKEMAQQARNHDDINVLALPANFITKEESIKCLEAFLNSSSFTDDKYQRRLKKISALEK